MPDRDLPETPPTIVPGPRPGYRTPRPVADITTHTKAALAAALMRAGVGLVCLAAAALYMPVHQVTPLLSGVAIVMIVTGTYSVWRVGIVERRLRRPTRVLAWLIPGLTLLLLAMMGILGPGSLGPEWRGPTAPVFDGTIRLESAP